MGQEIERKFLIRGEAWRSQGKGSVYRQGYIPTVKPGHTVRVRIAGDRAFLTIKGPAKGLSRLEYEYPIPLSDAEEMLEKLCDRPLIEKVRYEIPQGHHVWEVDEFLGDNRGLILAEIELSSETETFELPDWIEKEVTGDRRYYNSNLTKKPFSTW